MLGGIKRSCAEILAEIAGVGMSADAADLVAPAVVEAAAAIQACLTDAKLSPDHIDYVNAHGTGTIANDIIEIKAIKTAFGSAAPGLATPRRSRCMVMHLARAARWN